jgi:uncharacterized protein (TIGR03086 family)
MNDTELPIFPTTAPEAFADPAATRALIDPVLSHLAAIVEVSEGSLDRPSPCADYTVGQLRHHVLGWLQFFAAALTDPDAIGERLDPETWQLDPDPTPGAIVERAAADIGRAIDDGVAGRLVVMSQARMAGDGVLAMALGEYLVHGWDLAVSTGRGWPPAAPGVAHDAAAEAALAFLRGTVAPEYRGPDSGFFGHEVEASADATAFERLLCFAGRQPGWSPQAA